MIDPDQSAGTPFRAPHYFRHPKPEFIHVLHAARTALARHDRRQGQTVIDYGQEHNLIWVTGLSDSGEIWCAPNPLVRLQSNWTMGREPHHEPDWKNVTLAPIKPS